MKKNYVELYKKFNKIRNMGWIKSKRNGSTGIGYTFETLLNIEENSFAVPDYNGIEIKTMRIFSKKNIHLFNATPDGDYLFPIKRVLYKLGYPCKENKEYKVFLSAASGKEFSQIGYSEKIKLEIDRQHNKINLIAKDKYNNDIDISISWSFDLLKSKLYIKNKYLAIIKAKRIYRENIEYFHYVHIEFYEIKDFDTFLQLIELGIIKVTFKINVYKTGEKAGQIDDHGTDFSIKEKNIELLYNKVAFSNKQKN